MFLFILFLSLCFYNVSFASEKEGDIFSECMQNLGKLLKHVTNDENDEKIEKKLQIIDLVSKMDPKGNQRDRFIDTVKILSDAPSKFSKEEIEKSTFTNVDNQYQVGGNTPLHFACFDGDIKKLIDLVESNAENVPNDAGYFPVNYIRNEKFRDVIEKHFPCLFQKGNPSMFIPDPEAKIKFDSNLLKELEKERSVIRITTKKRKITKVTNNNNNQDPEKKKQTRKRKISPNDNEQASKKKKKTE